MKDINSMKAAVNACAPALEDGTQWDVVLIACAMIAINEGNLTGNTAAPIMRMTHLLRSAHFGGKLSTLEYEALCKWLREIKAL